MGKGSDGQKNGGETTDMIMGITGAVIGGMVGGPAGAAAGWQLGQTGGDLFTGKGDGSGGGTMGSINKMGDTAASVTSMASGAGAFGGSGDTGNALTKVLGQGGEGGAGEALMTGVRSDGSTMVTTGNSAINAAGTTGKAGGLMDEGNMDIMKRLLKFGQGMSGGQQQESNVPSPALMQMSPRYTSSAPVMYNTQAPQLIMQRPSIADNRRF